MVSPPHLDHFASDDETGLIILIVYRENTTEDGGSREAATTIRDRCSPTKTELHGIGNSPNPCMTRRERRRCQQRILGVTDNGPAMR